MEEYPTIAPKSIRRKRTEPKKTKDKANDATQTQGTHTHTYSEAKADVCNVWTTANQSKRAIAYLQLEALDSKPFCLDRCLAITSARPVDSKSHGHHSIYAICIYCFADSATLSESIFTHRLHLLCN